MKKTGMDGYTRIASNDKKLMVLRHPKGHEVKVAVGALSKEMKDHLMSLPQHFVKGGWVEGGEPEESAVEPSFAAPPPQAIPPDQLVQGTAAVAPGSALNSAIYNLPGAVPPDATPVTGVDAVPVDHSQEIHQASTPFSVPVVSPNATMATSAEPADESLPSPTITTPAPVAAARPDSLSVLQGAIGQQKAGLAAQAKAVGDLGNRNSEILDDAVRADQSAKFAYQDNTKKKMAAIDDFIQDQKNQHLDPNRVWANKSTGSKVSTVIGLILGGFGGGINHTENSALKVLNGEIDRDLETQKLEMGQKDNLLKANLLKYGSMDEAIKMTHAMANSTASLQMKQAEENARDPMAKAELQRARGVLDQQTSGLIDQMSRQKAIQAAAGSAGEGGKLSTLDPAKLLNYIPASDQKAAREELSKASEIREKAANTMSAFNLVNESTSPGFAVNHPFRAFSGAQQAQLNGAIAELNKAMTGRFNLEENKKLEEQFKPTRVDTDEDRQLKRDQLQKYITSGMNFPTLTQYNINPQNFASTALPDFSAKPSAASAPAIDQQQHAQWGQWAQQNPQNPLAQQYIRKMKSGS